MAQHKSAEKRHRQSLVKQAHNASQKSKMRTVSRKVRDALDNNKLEEAKASLPEAIKVIQKTASHGVIHKRNASRRVSRLMRQMNKAAGK